ncbi:MAG: group II intron reverse transcriptase/maturase [Pirellulales bacterium]
MSLPTLLESVQKLQMALQAKAKAEPSYRFYSLWDKVCRRDVLWEAYRRCRANGGAPGVDRVTFEQIETEGVMAWLAKLQEELRSKTYCAGPLLRVWIPKTGGQRPLGIPPIRDRVAQMALLLVIGPIFEADLCEEQYGFRSGVDAKMAIRRAYFHVTERGLREVVDGDLSDYFNTIPHGALMRCLSRRIADGQVLSTINGWLRTPVVERTRDGERRTTEAADKHRGVPQGGPASPMLANLYFRRFLLAWKKFGHEQRLQARVVNYADDLVICCRPGNGPQAMSEFRSLMTRLGLTVNERKTRLVTLPEESFDFLGYTIGRFYGRNGKPFIGTRPSKKAVRKLLLRIHEETSRRWNLQSPEERVAVLNPILRGWCGYFNQGPVTQAYRLIRQYTERRFRRWLMRREQRRGTGYKRYPDRYLYETLGLFHLPTSRAAVLNAKV